MGAGRDDAAARSAVLGAYDLDSEPQDAATRVSAHGDRRRVGPAFCGDRCARMGQRRRVFLRSAMGTTLSIDVGGAGVVLDLRHWVNSGLMTFFFVLGLEARREVDLGELRERRRFALPLLAGIGG